ncbi:MAG: hypothetical protein C0395_01640 [Gemmatimonas sp.]|nr:hypothetical protein [Gemmatimonas sp.]
MWNVAFFMPVERDVPLLAEAARRDDVRLLGVVAPDRTSPAAALAEVMGLTVWAGLDEAPFPRDTLMVGSMGIDPRRCKPPRLHAVGGAWTATASVNCCTPPRRRRSRSPK